MSECKHKIKWMGQFNEFVCSSCAEPFTPEHVAKVMNDRADTISELQSILEAAEARAREFVSLIKDADAYLDINELTGIGHGSILHREFKRLTNQEKGDE